MNFKTSLAFALSFPIVLLSPAAAEVHSADQANPCEEGRTLDKWYLSYRECPSGSQAALLATISGAEVSRSQISLFSNFALDEVGFQLSGGLNYAGHVTGAQIAIDMNIAQTVDGFQLAYMNFADTVRGSQFGFFNFSNRLEGHGLGLLTISDNGLLHLDVLAEETGMSKLEFASGKGFFTSYSFGYTFEGDDHPLSVGMGLGYHKPLGKAFIEGQLHGSLVVDESTEFSHDDDNEPQIGDSDWRHNTLLQLKLRAGTQVFSNIGIYGGLSYNFLDTQGNERLLGSWSEDLTVKDDEHYRWPGVEVGIRLGR